MYDTPDGGVREIRPDDWPKATHMRCRLDEKAQACREITCVAVHLFDLNLWEGPEPTAAPVARLTARNEAIEHWFMMAFPKHWPRYNSRSGWKPDPLPGVRVLRKYPHQPVNADTRHPLSPDPHGPGGELEAFPVDDGSQRGSWGRGRTTQRGSAGRRR